MRLKRRKTRVHVVIVPTSRAELFPALSSGKVDMVAAMVTVSPERERLVAFSEPTRIDVSQVVVTGPGAPPIRTVDDLAGQEVFVRKGSSYDDSLVALNARLTARGKPPVIITPAPDVLEDDDILEMVNAGLAPITVVDDYLAEFWSSVLTGITVHENVTVARRRTGRGVSQGESPAPGRGQSLDPEARAGRRVSQRARESLSRGPTTRRTPPPRANAGS